MAEDGAQRTSTLVALGATTAAQVAVGVVAAAGVLISAIGLLTTGDDAGAAVAVYAGGLGAGLLSLLAVGLTAAARGAGEVSTVEPRDLDLLHRQVEIHTLRLESVAGSLRSEPDHWSSDTLGEELRIGEQAYAMALDAGAVELAERLAPALAFMRAHVGEPAPPSTGPPLRRARRYTL
jgi:hypothetical protein